MDMFHVADENFKSFREYFNEYEKLKKEGEQIEHDLKVLRGNSKHWENNISFDKRPSIIILHERLQLINREIIKIMNLQVILK